MSKIKAGRVNVSVANLYREGRYRSEIVSQALLAEKITLLEQEKDFSRIRQTDGYEGWISNYQWVAEKPSPYPLRMVRDHLLKIYTEQKKNAQILREATAGTYLAVGRAENDWLEVELPDGEKGWANEKGFGKRLPGTRKAAVALAGEFYGIPYFWGGRSTKGFDCSGLVQTVFSMIGKNLPRDSWMQQRDGKFVSDDPADAQAGDLYFFSDNGNSITHVGLAAGSRRIIHARGLVRMNSLQPETPEFSEQLLATFVDVRTYF